MAARMTEEQRKRTESLFQAAVTLLPGERMAFLQRECSDDPVVFNEAASLISNYEKAGDFLKIVKQAMELPSAAFSKGKRMGGRYEVLSLLGRGGMGEVYLAQDKRLPRKVAIKILPSIFAGNRDLIERLQREAQAASSLNHPNILTIHEFGQEGELHYIVSEFVEGTSLRDLIGKISHEQALEYGRQIGQALAVAHAVGIVHRDIKPENIVVRNDGYIKVLDFGLAKLASRPLEAAVALMDSASVNGQVTQPGTLMGTLNYMSPEQARGETIDQRSDIWSWGVVLYEMLSGGRPFESSDVNDLQAAHALPLTVPGRNKRIRKVLSHALTPQLDQRYSTMEEVLRDLPNEPTWVLKRFMRKVALSFAPRDGILQWKPWAALILSLVLLGLGIEKIIDRMLDVTYHMLSVRPITTNGRVTAVACSPDGSYIVYAVQETGGQALRVIQLQSLADLEIVPPAGVEYSEITVSRNGLIYYVVRDNGTGKLYEVPLQGGNSKKVLEDIESAISFSPDEMQFAFYKEYPEKNSTALVLHDLASGREKELIKQDWPNVFLQSPLWGPGASQITIAVIAQKPPALEPRFTLQTISADSGQEITSIVKPWRWVGRFAWLNHGRELAIAAGSVGSSRAQLVQVKWPSGKQSPLVEDKGDYRGLSTSLDSQKIAMLQVERNSRLWIVSLQGEEQAHPVTVGGKYYGVSWTSSRQLLSQTEVDKQSRIWIINPDTRDEHPITNDSYSYQEAVGSPEGRYLVYVSDRDGTQHVWRSNPDGSNPIRLTTTSFRESSPTFTSKGDWVYFVSAEAGFTLKRVLITGGTSENVTEHNVKAPSISPDGRRIVCYYYLDPVQEWKVAVLNLVTNKVQIIPDIPSGDDALPIRWTADGKQLLYAAADQNHIFNIWAHRLDRVNGGFDRQVTHFTDDSIFAFAPSPDGKALALVRGSTVSDVSLMQITH